MSKMSECDLVMQDPIIIASRRIHALEGAEELKAAYEKITKLESALRHAQEALFWYKGGNFELDGKTIDEVIAEVLS